MEGSSRNKNQAINDNKLIRLLLESWCINKKSLKEKKISRWQRHVSHRQRNQTAVINKGNRWEAPMTHRDLLCIELQKNFMYMNRLLLFLSCRYILLFNL